MKTISVILVLLLLLECAYIGLRCTKRVVASNAKQATASVVAGGKPKVNQSLEEPPRMPSDFSGVAKSEPTGRSLANASSAIAQVSYSAPVPQSKYLHISSVEELSGGSTWVWDSSKWNEGVWLRSEKSSVTLKFPETSPEFTTWKSEIPETTKTGKAPVTLEFSKPGIYEIVAAENASEELTISIAPPGTRGIKIYVPNERLQPYPPSPSRQRLGKQHPWNAFKTTNSAFRNSTVSIEATTQNPNDELLAVALEEKDGNFNVLQLVSPTSLPESDANRKHVNILPGVVLGQTSLKTISYQLFTRQGNNHKFEPSTNTLNIETDGSTAKLEIDNIAKKAKSSAILLSRNNVDKSIEYSGAPTKASRAIGLFIDGQIVSTVVATTATGKFENVVFPEGQHSVSVAVLDGDNEAVETRSLAVPIEVRTGGLSVTKITPKDFGNRLGANTIEISFSRPITNDKSTVGSAIELKLSNSGVDGPYSEESGTSRTVELSQTKDRAIVTVVGVKPGLHRLSIRSEAIVDAFGNKLEGKTGTAGEVYEEYLGQATSSALVSDPLVPGVTRGRAPMVEYPSVIPSKEQPRGFNPNDRVETRVARLYFFRDAHRVAQILNRRAQSYNIHDVTMRRQLADKARQEAEAITSQRQISERDAVEKARRTREMENQLSDAQRTLNYSLQQMQQLAVQPVSDPSTETAKRREAQLAQLEIAARSNAEQVRALESRIASARDVEVAANERWQQAQRSEDLSRAEQFRLETSAAHADPDTFAEGKIDSVDSIAQVSISVIGEGVLHLRGPLRGVNQVRMMIDQIDSPCGQVRVNVHSTQINGDEADELETVANRIQTYIDQARFLTLQSGEMLRKAVLHVAAARAEEARGLYPGETQADRDQRYLHAFFGKDFVDELRAMDSEFLQTGNKLLSLHSMDVTSLSSALTVMALANNSTRLAILQEFERLLQTDLSVAEQQFLKNSINDCMTKKCKHGCRGACKHKQPPPVFQLTGNATFTGLRGFFDANVAHDDTMSPLQREVIRLAQILKARLITEMELKQRIMERAVIEERLQSSSDDMETVNREREASATLRSATLATLNVQAKLIPSVTRATATVDAFFSQYAYATNEAKKPLEELVQMLLPGQKSGELKRSLETIRHAIAQSRKARADMQSRIVSSEPAMLFEMPNGIPFDVYTTTPGAKTISNIDEVSILVGTVEQRTNILQSLRSIVEKLKQAENYIDKLRPKQNADSDPNQRLESGLKRLESSPPNVIEVDRVELISLSKLDQATQDILKLLDNQQRNYQLKEDFEKAKQAFIAEFANASNRREVEINSKVTILVYQAWTVFASSARQLAQGDAKTAVDEALRSLNEPLDQWLTQVAALEGARAIAQTSRRPLDHKKFLDMLIDDLEEKYIELLEGTRAHTSNIDNYLKRLTTSLDDDFNTQFYFPVFRSVRQASQAYKVEFGQTETTNVLANNRELGKVSPSATMEFDLPKRDILIKEGIDSALAIYNDVGALVNDPNLLALAKMQSGQSTASPGAGTLGGYGAVRNVYPGLGTDTSSRLVSQNAGSGPQFESNVEKLIPDPAIYKFETGTGYEIRPVIAPDGQAVVFDFNYMYTTQVREPVRADEKHLGRVKQHFIDTDVQLSNFELREVSRYVVALKAARTAKGVPLLEDIPVVGGLWRPLPSDEKSLQQNIIMAQATIFPTLFDLMGLRWAPAVADLDPLRLSNREYLVRNRHRFLENRIYDYSSSRVDEFLRVPETVRRPDLYRSQETIPQLHPNGYSGPGLDVEISPMRSGYDPQIGKRYDESIPGASSDGSLDLRSRNYDLKSLSPPRGAPIEEVAPARLQPNGSEGGDWEYSRGRKR